MSHRYDGTITFRHSYITTIPHLEPTIASCIFMHCHSYNTLTSLLPRKRKQSEPARGLETRKYSAPTTCPTPPSKPLMDFDLRSSFTLTTRASSRKSLHVVESFRSFSCCQKATNHQLVNNPSSYWPICCLIRSPYGFRK